VSGDLFVADHRRLDDDLEVLLCTKNNQLI
jgi:hypothetical protein